VHTDYNYTEDEKKKLQGIAEGAEVNVVKSVDTTTEHGVQLILGPSDGKLELSEYSGKITEDTTDPSRNYYVTGLTVATTLAGVKTYINDNLALKANTASPALTGTPTAPTATAGTNTTQIATTEFVTNAVSTAVAAEVVKSVDTTASHGIALTLGNSTGELGISVSQGTIGANQSAFVSGGRIYEYVTNQLIPNLAPIASPAFTGTPTAPTPTSSSGQTQIANVAFVEDRIMAAIESITGIDFQIVQTLPASGTKGVIYLVPNSGTNPNSYDEYIWITPSGDTGRFEKIGTTDVDLSGYLQISSVITNAEIDAIVAN
jgi:hypothetical protein